MWKWRRRGGHRATRACSSGTAGGRTTAAWHGHDDAEGEEGKEGVREGRNLTSNAWLGSEAKGTASSDGNRAGQPPDREEEDDGDGSM